jgi:uncharacterized protein YaaR (DUF327 family)
MEVYMITKLENKLTKLNKKFALCEEHEAWQILSEIDEVEGRIDMLRTGNPPSAYGFTEGGKHE